MRNECKQHPTQSMCIMHTHAEPIRWAQPSWCWYYISLLPLKTPRAPWPAATVNLLRAIHTRGMAIGFVILTMRTRCVCIAYMCVRPKGVRFLYGTNIWICHFYRCRDGGNEIALIYLWWLQTNCARIVDGDGWTRRGSGGVASSGYQCERVQIPAQRAVLK